MEKSPSLISPFPWILSTKMRPEPHRFLSENLGPGSFYLKPKLSSHFASVAPISVQNKVPFWRKFWYLKKQTLKPSVLISNFFPLVQDSVSLRLNWRNLSLVKVSLSIQGDHYSYCMRKVNFKTVSQVISMTSQVGLSSKIFCFQYEQQSAKCLSKYNASQCRNS